MSIRICIYIHICVQCLVGDVCMYTQVGEKALRRGDDYEEIGKRGNTREEKEFRDELANQNLPDYYEILGIKKDATAEQIKKSFRELAKKTHPDKTKEDSEQEMIKINKAYEVLSDEESKEKYDRYFKSS